MNIAQRNRIVSFTASLRARGRDATTDAGKKVQIIVEDQVVLQDVTEEAKQKTPVYTTVHGLAGCVDDARAVVSFTEDESGRRHTVIRFQESAGNEPSWKWFCEAVRGPFEEEDAE